ncbi:hypothetical protein CEXT_382921 [Caerostris extrusa]|uniref:Uncharacterized protein n=1 Tax=Caerostris extrusa TaxID=172846 RepID=A0AAV4W2W8_CAEEX|nr:hypothetical protein CEXT_382921 [Caerostris extrusa]
MGYARQLRFTTTVYSSNLTGKRNFNNNYTGPRNGGGDGGCLIFVLRSRCCCDYADDNDGGGLACLLVLMSIDGIFLRPQMQGIVCIIL